MVKNTTIFIINGSSLGGGEVDAIIRASLCNGKILALTPPVPEVRALAEEKKVTILYRTSVMQELAGGTGTLVCNGFIRDLTLAPYLLMLKIKMLNRLNIILAVHSDPLNSVAKVRLRVIIAVWLYQVFGLIFANRVRFVSAKQMKSFSLLSRYVPFYIDGPTSFITRKQSTHENFKYKNIRRFDFIFIGRLSTSQVLGDAKNSEFVLSMAQLFEVKGHNFRVIASGNRIDIIDKLKKCQAVTFEAPTSNVEDAMLSAKIVLVPSNHEGYCLIVREAAILGCTVMTTEAVAQELITLPNIIVMKGFDQESWYKTAIDELK